VLKKRVPGLIQKELTRGGTFDESYDGGISKGGRRSLNKSIL